MLTLRGVERGDFLCPFFSSRRFYTEWKKGKENSWVAPPVADMISSFGPRFQEVVLCKQMLGQRKKIHVQLWFMAKGIFWRLWTVLGGLDVLFLDVLQSIFLSCKESCIYLKGWTFLLVGSSNSLKSWLYHFFQQRCQHCHITAVLLSCFESIGESFSLNFTTNETDLRPVCPFAF